jgi:hypothetical protein
MEGLGVAKCISEKWLKSLAVEQQLKLRKG